MSQVEKFTRELNEVNDFFNDNNIDPFANTNTDDTQTFSFSDFVCDDQEMNNEKMFQHFKEDKDINIDELIPMCFEGEKKIKSVLCWTKEDGVEFVRQRQQQNNANDDERSVSACDTAASVTLSVSMSASLPQNESVMYIEKWVSMANLAKR